MDKFFTNGAPPPLLSTTEIERMTQVALSYTQQKAPIRPSFWSFFLTPARMGAAAGFACFILAVGLAFYQSSIPDTDTYEQFSAISDDPYADVTEIAILNTLDSF